MKYISKYKCRICTEIITKDSMDRDAVDAIIPRACYQVNLSINNHPGVSLTIPHETDTHLGIADFIGFVKDDERVKAHWVIGSEVLTTWPAQYNWHCSNCNYVISGIMGTDMTYPDCPKCNANMMGSPIRYAHEVEDYQKPCI